MKIKLSESFVKQLSRQVAFIASDNPQAARKFKSDVLIEIKAIPRFPFKNRKSIFFEKENFRDLIFKGYVITYEISEKEIIVFALTKYKKFEE